MNNEKNLLDIKSLLIAIILSICISKGFEISHPLYISIMIVVFYVLFLTLHNKKETIIFNHKHKNAKKAKSNKVNKSNFSNLERFSSRESKNDALTSSKNKVSPFEGLFPQQLKNRLNYLYYATSHPFKAKSYTDYVYSKGDRVPKSIKHLDVSREYYPQLTEDQVNYNDCMNFPKGDPKSCNQGNDKWEAENSILTSGIKNEKDLNQVVREDFNAPLSILENTKNNLDILFKNAPSVVNTTPKDLSDDLCSHCVV